MKMVTVVICAAALSACAGCSSALTYAPRADALAPGADLRVGADVDPTQHLTRVRVRAANLPPPGRLAPNGRAFVVWARPNQSAQWGRVGVLAYDEGDRRGELVATVPFLTFDLIVTTESAAEAPAPSDKLLIAQHVGAS